jgi:hypothetical protein
MKLSKEQIEVLAKDLSHTFGSGVKLLCDGYTVALQVEKYSKKGLEYCVMTYVNGYFKGEWCGLSKQECPEQKFMRKLVKPRCSPAYKRKMIKIFGKRHVDKDPYYTETQTSYWPNWSNGKAALNHLNRVCESVQLAE